MGRLENLGPAFFAGISAFLMMNWWYIYLPISDFEALALGTEIGIILFLLLSTAREMEIKLWYNGKKA